MQHGSSVSQPARGSSRTSSSSSSTRTKLPKERYGSNLLYSSSEEEDNTVTPRSRSTTNHHRNSTTRATCSPPTDTNPFENFTVGKSNADTIIGQHQSIRSSEISGQRSKNRLPLSATVAISGHSSRFNPLGQVEGCIPALIPENEDKEGGYGGRGSSRDNDGDLPLIDDWLVDDMSGSRKDQPPAKRRKHQLSSGASRKEIRSFLEGSTCSSAAPSQGGGGRKRQLQQKNRTAGLSLKKRSPSGSVSVSNDSRQCTNDEQSSSKKRKMMIVDDSSSDSDERFLDTVLIIEEDMMDSDGTTSTLASTKSSHRQTGEPSATSGSAVGMCMSTPQSRFSSSRPSSRNSSSERQSSLLPYQSSSSGLQHVATCGSNARIDSATALNHQFQTTPQSLHSIATTSSAPNITATCMSYSDTPPLRVRVKIESKSYLIPCPRKDLSGLDTTIQWLISQASERHYTQQGLGARPRLSLTTSDGAILCPTDLVSHVLSPNEEVVGVVEGWVQETLEESYLAVCKKERVGE